MKKRETKKNINKNTNNKTKNLVELDNNTSDKLEGRNAILEALNSEIEINKLFVAKGELSGSIIKIINLAKKKGIIIKETERSKLDAMSSSRNHQGVIAMVSPVRYVEVDEILNNAKMKNEPPFIILLDELTDPNNFGSILRTADCVGAHGVIIPKRRSVTITPTVTKVSAGASLHVPVSRITNIAQTLDYLKEKGLWVIGTDMSGQEPYYDANLKGPICLVIGSEDKGMGRLVTEKCDIIVNIPMIGKISSLNAGVAAAIVMYEIFKQRNN